MKKWHLHEHLADVIDWWRDSHDEELPFVDPPGEQLRFIAYERWLNNRDLLTIEDGYEWQWSLNVLNENRSPAPGRPVHEGAFTHMKIEEAEDVETQTPPRA